MNDTEMLDWLAERCWFPYSQNEICITFQLEQRRESFDGTLENVRRALREAIQKARLKELHKEVE